MIAILLVNFHALRGFLVHSKLESMKKMRFTKEPFKNANSIFS